MARTFGEHPLSLTNDKRVNKLRSSRILMRWKERDYLNVSAEDAGLTIAGFYYIALHRQSGKIQGLYFDPCSKPFQHLNLTATSCPSFGNWSFS